MKKIALFILSIFTFLNIYSQRIAFRTDSLGFYSDFFDYAKKSKKNGEEVYKKMHSQWDSLYFTDNEKVEIIRNMNSILKKNARLIPQISNYLEVLYSFNDNQHNHQSYLEWNKAFTYYIKRKSLTQINQLLIITKKTLDKNILYQKVNLQWYHTGTFKYEYKKHKLIANFSKGNLIGKLLKDSIIISQTSGKLYPFTKTWEGIQGKVDWRKTSLDSNARYVNLLNYKIKLHQTGFKATKVSLTDKIYGISSIDGDFEDKISSMKRQKNSSFPRFKSYSEKLKLKNIFGWINYTGGVEIKGYKLYGFVDKEYRANLWLTQNSKNIAHFRSRSFVFRDSLISSLNSSVEIELDTSSFYHAGINFKIIGKKITFFRANQGIGQSPFHDNFHQIDIFADIAIWNVNKQQINFKNNITSSKGYIYIRSADFFDPEDPLLKGNFPRNPALIIRDFGASEFSAEELARYMRAPSRQVSYMLMALSFKGLIEYDQETHRAKLLPQFENYLQKLSGNEDYDNLHMLSQPKINKNAGAILNLKNNELTVMKLLPIPISEKRNLVVRPKNDSIVFKTGRNFNFDGSLTIGSLGFVGKNFKFDYNQFKINLDSVDYMTIKVPEQRPDSSYTGKILEVKNVIEKIRGDILIDDPTNKSGLDSFPEYPILTTYDTSYVYYDKVVKPLGVYPRNKFYFQIYPYKIDSLSHFSTEKFNLLGEFHSDSIFPVFKDVDLIIQPDLSLGFDKPSSQTGDSLYAGKGLFFNDIVLNSRGLNAQGTIKYLNSSITSSFFHFYPDSMTTLAKKFVMDAQTKGYQFPDIQTDDDSILIQWYPQNDSLWINNGKPKTKKIILHLYQREARLNGKLLIQPQGAIASGGIQIKNGHFDSKNYKFKSRTFEADSSDFILRTNKTPANQSTQYDSSDFRTVNVEAKVDFNQRIATLKSNGSDSYIDFPQNQYLCYMSQMVWYMDKDNLDMKSVADSSSAIAASGAQFLSINPKQDSLRFLAQTSTFDATNKIITAKGVSEIAVANSLIIPKDGVVTIKKRAQMQTIDNAKIETENFTFLNSSASIQGKYKLVASGKYNYIDENDSVEIINMNIIEVNDTTKILYAHGKISQLQKFKLSKAFNYFGNVKINTNDSLALFDGNIQLEHSCDKLKINPITRPFYKFKTKINPDSIIIPIVDVNHENAPYVATLITNDSTHIYSSFLNPSGYWSDRPIIKSEGVMFYDKHTHTYSVASSQKLHSPEERGNILMLNKDFCKVYGQGSIDFGVKYGQLKINACGEVFHKIQADKVDINSSYTIDFFFNQQLKDIIYDKFKQAQGLKALDLSLANVKRDFIELAGKQNVDKMYSELGTTGEIKTVPTALNKTFVFSNLKLKWNKETKTFINDGPIGISFIDGKPVNKMVYGYIEFTKKKSGNLLKMYIETDKKTWFFFTFSQNVLKTYSSISEYNDIIRNLKAKDKRMEVARNQKPFSFNLSSERIKNKFLYRVEPVDDEDEF